LVETLRNLSHGERLSFGDVLVDKDGILLQKHGWINDDRFHETWENLTISSGDGSFIIRSTTDRKAYAFLPYRDVDNVHILEAIMRFLWKDGNHLKLMKGEFA
jgi:hypothetical protein